MAKTACKILGVVLILVGIVGFFAHNLLGLHLTLVHNIIHLLSGAIALYFGFVGTSEAAHTFSRIIGVIYLLVGIVGFITPGVIEKIFQTQATTESLNLIPDNIVHLLVGALFLIVGFLREPQPAAPKESKVS
ncbi:MAG: DUF4383 domain-containing protein [Acidobacteria bacterium]|nr:DUF4383 domain-containing protein [Acidobacteriota bacterium]